MSAHLKIWHKPLIQGVIRMLRTINIDGSKWCISTSQTLLTTFSLAIDH